MAKDIPPEVAEYLDCLVRVAAEVFEIPRWSIFGRRKFDGTMRARKAVAYIARHELRCSYRLIGYLFGLTHADVWHLVRHARLADVRRISARFPAARCPWWTYSDQQVCESCGSARIRPLRNSHRIVCIECSHEMNAKL